MAVGPIVTPAVATPPDGAEPVGRGKDPQPAHTIVRHASGPDGAPSPDAEATHPKKKPAELRLSPAITGVARPLHLRIEVDASSGRYVYLGVDPKTGEVVNQYPSKAVLEEIAFQRKAAGQVLDEKT